jgi:adenylosuccinate synthase
MSHDRYLTSSTDVDLITPSVSRGSNNLNEQTLGVSLDRKVSLGAVSVSAFSVGSGHSGYGPSHPGAYHRQARKMSDVDREQEGRERRQRLLDAKEVELKEREAELDLREMHIRHEKEREMERVSTLRLTKDRLERFNKETARDGWEGSDDGMQAGQAGTFGRIE